MPDLQFVESESSRLCYTKQGTGRTSLLLFHGYGQDHSAFQEYVPLLGDTFTFYSFDLFFHGQSKWNRGDTPVEKEYWRNLIQTFLVENRIEKFCLLGFSIGAKFVLTTLEIFPEKTDRVFLLAPDGISTSFWYRLATSTQLFRSLFKSMITHPNRFHRLARSIHSLGLIDSRLLRFVEHQMDQEAKRQRVYLSWVVFRHLKFHLKSLAHQFHVHHIPLLIFIGKRDSLITADSLDPLLHHLHDCKVELLETGHAGVIEAAGKFLGKFSS